MTTKTEKLIIDTSFEEFEKSFMEDGDTEIKAHIEKKIKNETPTR